MIKYEEVISRCNNCGKLNMCAEALNDTIWTTHIPIPEDINCEHLPKLGEAIKEHVQERICKLHVQEMNMHSPSMTQIIETLLEADNLPRIPKKINVSPNMYQLLSSMRDTNWTPSVEFETLYGIPVEIDRDLFGYTYELVY